MVEPSDKLLASATTQTVAVKPPKAPISVKKPSNMDILSESSATTTKTEDGGETVQEISQFLADTEPVEDDHKKDSIAESATGKAATWMI